MHTQVINNLHFHVRIPPFFISHAAFWVEYSDWSPSDCAIKFYWSNLYINDIQNEAKCGISIGSDFGTQYIGLGRQAQFEQKSLSNILKHNVLLGRQSFGSCPNKWKMTQYIENDPKIRG